MTLSIYEAKMLQRGNTAAAANYFGVAIVNIDQLFVVIEEEEEFICVVTVSK